MCVSRQTVFLLEQNQNVYSALLVLLWRNTRILRIGRNMVLASILKEPYQLRDV